MPKFFDTIKDQLSDTVDIGGGSALRDVASRITPDAVENRVPQAFKDYLANATLRGPQDPRTILSAMAVDHEVGLQTAQAAFPQNWKGVPVEGLMAEILRPSNLLPVSKAGSLLKAGNYGKPMLKELLKEGMFSGAFAAGDTARQEGAGIKDIALSATMGGVLGSVTPLGFHYGSRGLDSLRGKKVSPDAIVDNILEEGADASTKPRRTRTGVLTVEERIALVREGGKDRVLATIKKNIDDAIGRRTRAQERFENPLEPRGNRKGGVYLEDFLVQNGHRYERRHLEADAMQEKPFPVIAAGGYKWSERTKVNDKWVRKTRSVGISIQEAEALRDLYIEHEAPNDKQIKKALNEARGRSPKKGDISEEGKLRIQEARLKLKEAQESFEKPEKPKGKRKQREVKAAEVPEDNPVRVAEANLKAVIDEVEATRTEATTKVVPVDDARVATVREYVEKQAPRAMRPVKRPSPLADPKLRPKVRSIRQINEELQRGAGELAELDRKIAQDRRKLEAAASTDNPEPEKIVRKNLLDRARELRRKADNLPSVARGITDPVSSKGRTTKQITNTPTENLEKMVADAFDKLSNLGKPNKRTAEKILGELESNDFDVSEQQGLLDEYIETQRSDFDSAEEYADERESLWEQFVESMEELELPDSEIVDADFEVSTKNPVAAPPTDRENPQKEALLKEILEIDDMLNGRRDLPADLLAAARAEVQGPVHWSTATQLANNEERWRMLTKDRDALLAARAREIGVEISDVPLDPDEQLQLLARTHGGKIAAGPPELPRSQAQDILNRWDAEVDRIKADKVNTIEKETAREARLRELQDAIESGLTGGRVPGVSLLNEASLRLRDWKEARRLRDENPGGVNRQVQGTETLLNYADLAFARASSEAAGMKNLGQVARQSLRNLAGYLQSVGTKDGPPGARPFIERPDGSRDYGSIKLVRPAEDDPGQWLVDFVPIFNPSRGVIPDVRVKDIQVEYRGDDIEGRYAHEREMLLDSRSQESTFLMEGDSPEVVEQSRAITRARQQRLASLRPLTIDQEFIKTADDLNADVNAAWENFEDSLLPLAPEEVSGMTAFQRMMREGFIEITNAPLVKDKKRAIEQVSARNRLAQSFRDFMLDNAGLAIDDPDLHIPLDQNGDPARMFLYLLRRGDDPEGLIKNDQMAGIVPRRVRRAMDMVMGRGFQDRRVGGINTNYHWSRNAMSENIRRNFSGLTQEWRRLAYAEVGSQSKRPSALRFAKGDVEFETVLAREFNPKPKAGWPPILARAMKKIDELPDVVKAEVLDWMSRQPRFLIDFPELFPGIGKEYLDVAAVGRGLIKRSADLTLADSGGGLSQGYVNRLMLTPKLREAVTAKTLSEGHPLEVVAEAAQIAHDKQWKFREIITSGEELLHAEPLAYGNAALDHRVKTQIGRLIDDEFTLEKDDIIHTAGRWKINSLHKWTVRDENGGVLGQETKDLQESVKQLEQGLNRLPDWKGLQRASQVMASVALSADANIISVQGFSAISSRFLYDLANLAGSKGKSAKAFGRYLSDIQGVMSDEGFHLWYKTRADDIEYYVANGLTSGIEAMIAGPKLNKLPLENMPFVGNLPKGIREFNDLQFNRMLFYMKVNAIDGMLGKANLLRKIGSVASKPFTALPGIKSMMDEAAGESAFFHGQPEDVVRAAIRATNNKMGGVDLNVQGVTQWRQAAEQIMSITPGFFRAQAGMVSTALTRPHSVEGWMAITGIAEEVAVAATIATLFAAATGNTGKLNLYDMTRADWMAIPFNDSYIPVIPRVGIPRLAARVLRETIDAAASGDLADFDVGPPIQSFAQGRMSPLLNATLGPTFFDQDFLGRKYRDKKDRAFAAITSFMPIFAENLATESRESVEQDGWGALSSLTYQTPLQFMGKNIVPRPPIDKLDEIAANYTEEQGQKPRTWFQLTSDERETLQQNPRVKAAFDDFDYYNKRRASTKEIQIEATFQEADRRTDELRLEPVPYKGVSMTMKDAYSLLQAGKITGDEYRERLSYVNGRINENMDSMGTHLKGLGLDLEAGSEEKQAKLRELFKGQNHDAILSQLAVWDSQKIQPEDYDEEKVIQTPDGPVSVMETDWDAFQRDREAVLEGYDSHIQQAAIEMMDKWDDAGITQYREASQLRAAIEEMPRYRGLSNAQADKIDAMTKSFRDLNDVVRAKIGLPGTVAPLPKGMSDAIRAIAIKQFAAQGFLKTKEDMKLVAITIMLQDEPILREIMRGPEQLSALINNPQVLMFYPYLFGRVPVWMRGQLPANLQPQFDINARYEQVSQ